MAHGEAFKVLIIGAGMSGLTLAHQLKKNHISFEIFERDPDKDARQQGWALSLFGDALTELQTMEPELGPLEQTSHLRPLDLSAEFAFYDITRPDMRVGVRSDESGKIIRANRQRLREWLLQGIDVQFNKRPVEIKEHGDTVVVHFQDGSSASGTFLIGAEGTRSVVRSHILKDKDVMGPLRLGSVVGEVELTGEDFEQQLKIAHSGYIVSDTSLPSSEQRAAFCALNKVSDDGKTGYYYVVFLWIDEDGLLVNEHSPHWTATKTQQELADFARSMTSHYPAHLRHLIERIPTTGYLNGGFQLQGVQLEASDLPAGRVMVIGDAAHSMTPFRGEAGVCAFTDAMKLGRTLAKIRDQGVSGDELEQLMVEFRDDMLARGKWATEVSNPVLEDYGRFGQSYRYGTFGKEAVPIEPLSSSSFPALQKVSVSE